MRLLKRREQISDLRALVGSIQSKQDLPASVEHEIATYYLNVGDLRLALNHSKLAVKKHPIVPGYRLLKGRVLSKLGYLEEAFNQFDIAETMLRGEQRQNVKRIKSNVLRAAGDTLRNIVQPIS
jgi:tetratricopeptide (TPR) repeat protein